MPLPLVTAALALTAGLSHPPVARAPGDAWRWPLAGVPVVSRPFQPPLTLFGPGHRGVDLAAGPHAPVLAAGAGVVTFAGYVAGVGVVTVAHSGGLRTTYEPVLPSVHAGLVVAAGSELGSVMPGHGSCGPGRWCLHWGLLRGRSYLDPLTLVRRGPVRLLPVLVPGVGPAAAADRLAAASPVTGAGGQAELRVVAASPRPVHRRGAGPDGPRVLGTTVALAGAAGVGLLAGTAPVRRRSARAGRHRRTAEHGLRRGLRLLGISPAGRRAWP